MFDSRHLPCRPLGQRRSWDFLLEDFYKGSHDTIARLDEQDLSRPLRPRLAFFADEPTAASIAHVNREVMHHGGEICLPTRTLPNGRGGVLGIFKAVRRR